MTIYLVALGLSAGIGLFLWQVFRRMDPADVEGYAGCKGWCEAELADCGGSHPTQVPEQPVNTYTNMMYAAAGIVVAGQLDVLTAYVFGLAMVVLCVGSSLYHALATSWSGRFDVGGMYGVFSALAIYAIGRAMGVPEKWTALAMLVLGSAMGLLGFFIRAWYSKGMHLKIAIFLIVPYLLAAERIVVHDTTGGLHLTWGSFAVFGAAMTAWQLDKRCIFPLERWGHGIWHLLTGTATAMLFLAVEHLT